MSARHVPLLTLLLAIGLATPVAAKGPRKNEDRPGPDRLGQLEARLAELERQIARRPLDISSYRLPEKLEFCGERVDLSDPVIRERMELELLLILGDRAQVMLWLKRSGRVFPVVEQQARELGTCEDLKYLAVVESGLRPAVESRASARGWWQFMAGTARDYGLGVDRVWDERADLAQSTRAGLSYLKDLRGQFGSWSLAMAAYNTGPGRLRRAQQSQGIEDFWRLDLYTEAERYVPRVIAVKTVLANLSAYGFEFRQEDAWKARDVGHVKVHVPAGRSIEVLAAARGSGIDYRMLRILNPELGQELLPTGQEVVIEVPRGKEAALRGFITEAIARGPAQVAESPRKAKKQSRAGARRDAEDRPPARAVAAQAGGPKKRSAGRPAAKPKQYTVQAGDSLWAIAQKAEVSVDDLRKWNGLAKGKPLQPGQRLIVKR